MCQGFIISISNSSKQERIVVENDHWLVVVPYW